MAALRTPHVDTLDRSLVEGSEVTLILVVSPTCSACRQPVMKTIWRNAVAETGARAAESGAVLRTAGVGVSQRPEDGFAFLEEFGDFHEVTTGRAWGNLAVRHYIFQELPGPASVPQVIEVERMIIREANGFPVVSGESVRRRVIGIEELVRAFGGSS